MDTTLLLKGLVTGTTVSFRKMGINDAFSLSGEVRLISDSNWSDVVSLEVTDDDLFNVGKDGALLTVAEEVFLNALFT